MSAIDSLIGFAIISIFFFIIGSKIWEHEKETLRPIVRKVKGWFATDESDDIGPDDDFEISYRGNSSF